MTQTSPNYLNKFDIWQHYGITNSPITSLPDGKIMTVVGKRYGVPASQMLARLGTIAVMVADPEPAFHERFLWLPPTTLGLSGKAPSSDPNNRASNLTEADIRRVSDMLPCVRMEGNDFGEGEYFMYESAQQYRWWLQARKDKYANLATNPYQLVRRDFGFHGSMDSYQGGVGEHWRDTGGGSVSPIHPRYTSMYDSVQNARNSCGYWSSGLANLVGTNIKFYPDIPNYAWKYYIKKHAAEVMAKGLGRNGGLLGEGFFTYSDWGKIEGLGDAIEIHVGLEGKRRIISPAGYAITRVHPNVSYNFMVGAAFFIGFVTTDGVTPFDTFDLFGTNPNTMSGLNPNPTNLRDKLVLWQPDQLDIAAPALEKGGYPEEPLRWHDAAHQAAQYYSSTYRTGGQPWRYTRYRENGGSWIEPQSNGSDILYHAAANDGPGATHSSARMGRGDSMYRVEARFVDWAYFDPSRPEWDIKLIEADIAGRTFPLEARGNTLYVMNETI
nr:hypothetical protein [uncultured Arsenicibacter sp.]